MMVSILFNSNSQLTKSQRHGLDTNLTCKNKQQKITTTSRNDKTVNLVWLILSLCSVYNLLKRKNSFTSSKLFLILHCGY